MRNKELYHGHWVVGMVAGHALCVVCPSCGISNGTPRLAARKIPWMARPSDPPAKLRSRTLPSRNEYHDNMLVVIIVGMTLYGAVGRLVQIS
jgi:hypothetical protein